MIKSDSITLALSGVMLLVIMIGIIESTMGTASATTGSVNKVQSGLVSSDSFTTGNTSGWTFGGTATLYNSYEDSQGLHFGVQSPNSGQWVNHYAAAAKANAHLFHAGLTIPYASVADGVFNPGLYVEGSNYAGIVGCQAYADHTGYYWIVQYSTNAGSTWNTLYAPPRDSLPQTEDCTVMTSGSNYLDVYIGGKVVFSSTTMSLNMPTPLHAFVQADTSSSSMDYTTYSNYYSTTDENIKVTNNTSNAATVQIVGTTGNVLATAPVSAGTATLNVGMYTFPLSGTINVYDSNNSIIASSPASIYGGDVFSVTSPSVTPTTPQPPTGLTATTVSTSQINLSWNAPSVTNLLVTGYKIERSTDSGTTWSTIVSNTGSTSTTYSDTGLAASTTYTYRVSAIYLGIGTSSPSNTASATTQAPPATAPGSPTSLTATTISSSQINLSWTAPANNGGSPITGYKIERSTDGITFTVIAANTASTSTTYSDAGLAASTTYTYRVSAINSVGTSNPSNTASATTQAPPATAPGSPTSLTATTISSSQINLSWTAPSNNGGSAITGYKIERSTGSGTTWSTIVPNTGSISTAYSDTGLNPSTSYTYRISAINSIGTSSPSNTASATTQAPPATAPGSPTGLTATAVSTSQINLSWTAPSNNGGSAITGYKIERSTDSGTTWSIISSNTASTGTTYSDAGLAASTTYTYRVSAINSVGTSSPSNTASATTSATAPGSPTGLTATTVSSSQINLSWTASTSNGGSAITGYKIERSTDSGTTWSTIVPNTGSTSTTYSDTGLAQNTSYTYRVSAINSVGISSPSNTASATTSTTATAPGSPTGLTATTISSSQINLSWTAPSNNGGSAITSYKIERSTDGITFTVIAANTASTSTTYSDTGLAASTTYTYRVSAINSVGTSSPSNTSSATTSSSTGTTQVIISVKSVDLSGTPINGMSVVIRYTNGTTISDTFTPASFTVTSGTTYIVHARNYGTDVFNHWQDGTTNSYYTITPTQSVTLTAYYSTGTVTSTVPSAPQNLQATGGNAQVSLSWTAPSNNGGSAITGYEVERSKGSLSFGGFSNSTSATFFSAPNATAFTDNGLSASTTYNYTVFAKNSIGSSYRSNTASATTFSVSQPPTGLTATAASTSQINLSWTAPANNGGSAITGYKIDRSNNTGTTWSTVVFNTASTGTTYSDTGLNPSTSYTYRISAINSIGTSSPSNTASATTNQPSLTLMKSGLLISDSLTNETATQQQLQTNSKYWIYGGDAIAEKAPYAFWRNTQGLHIGVQAPSNGTWAGVYSVSRNTPAMLYHSVITTPVQTIPKNNVYYNIGMYVQTNGSNNVNYVTCASNISSFGTVWAVFWATGNPFGATNFTRLWYDPSPNQPLTRDCTVITNGNNYLKVYLDGIKVVDSNKMNLLMPSPFNVFLEPQSSYAGQLLNGTFTDYYALTSENVTVTNLPSNTVRVDIVDSLGNVLATSQVANQIASLNVGQYHFPLSGTIKLYDSSNTMIASRSSGIYSGDVYSVNP